MDPTQGWSDFLVATAGVIGALAGLVFVALSINLSRILGIPGMSGRAAETILLLAGALFAALLALVPGLTPEHLGLLLLAVAVPTFAAPNIIQYRANRAKQVPARYAIQRFVLQQLATLPMFLAGFSLLGWFAGGLRWLVLSLLLCIAVALINAWVLLVEILR